MDVVERELRGLDLERIFFGEVAELFDVGVLVERVVVEVHLRVEREQVARRRDDERVDLDHRRVGGEKRVVQRRRELDELGDLRAVEANRKANLPCLERHDADAGLDIDLRDLVGRLLGDLFDVHAAFGAGHHHGLAGGAIEHEADIQLARHLQAFFDQQAPHDAAFGAGLVRDERHAEHVARDARGFVGRLGELDAPALPAAARMNLRLDDDHAGAEARGNRRDIGGIGGLFASRHGNAVTRQDGFGLILVDFHDDNKRKMLTCERP